MTAAERKVKIDSYGAAYSLVKNALAEFPRSMWQYKPAPDRWSIHEILVHLADSEVNSYIRCRCFVAEPGKTIMAYDQNLWTERLNYHKQNPDAALDLFRVLRQMSFDLLRSIPEDAWKNTVMHPESGVMTFERWLDIYEMHARNHVGQMRRNYEAWKAQTK